MHRSGRVGRLWSAVRNAAAAPQITDLLDVVLDSFIKTSATGGLGSIKAEVMADTAVALASGNVKLVSSKVSATAPPRPARPSGPRHALTLAGSGSRPGLGSDVSARCGPGATAQK